MDGCGGCGLFVYVVSLVVLFWIEFWVLFIEGYRVVVSVCYVCNVIYVFRSY